jgi:hypothetical protein
MLTLKRLRGEWVEIVHSSGDVLKVHVGRLYPHNAPYGDQPNVRLGFEGSREKFTVNRPDARKGGKETR